MYVPPIQKQELVTPTNSRRLNAGTDLLNRLNNLAFDGNDFSVSQNAGGIQVSLAYKRTQPLYLPFDCLLLPNADTGLNQVLIYLPDDLSLLWARNGTTTSTIDSVILDATADNWPDSNGVELPSDTWYDTGIGLYPTGDPDYIYMGITFADATNGLDLSTGTFKVYDTKPSSTPFNQGLERLLCYVDNDGILHQRVRGCIADYTMPGTPL